MHECVCLETKFDASLTGFESQYAAQLLFILNLCCVKLSIATFDQNLTINTFDRRLTAALKTFITV